jgi:hypothetical protein
MLVWNKELIQAAIYKLQLWTGLCCDLTASGSTTGLRLILYRTVQPTERLHSVHRNSRSGGSSESSTPELDINLIWRPKQSVNSDCQRILVRQEWQSTERTRSRDGTCVACMFMNSIRTASSSQCSQCLCSKHEFSGVGDIYSEFVTRSFSGTGNCIHRILSTSLHGTLTRTYILFTVSFCRAADQIKRCCTGT